MHWARKNFHYGSQNGAESFWKQIVNNSWIAIIGMTGGQGQIYSFQWNSYKV